jgi:hypothetical protein
VSEAVSDAAGVRSVMAEVRWLSSEVEAEEVEAEEAESGKV